MLNDFKNFVTRWLESRSKEKYIPINLVRAPDPIPIAEVDLAWRLEPGEHNGNYFLDNGFRLIKYDESFALFHRRDHRGNDLCYRVEYERNGHSLDLDDDKILKRTKFIIKSKIEKRD